MIFIVLQSRLEEEEGEERCGASVETDDEAWAGCKTTLRVPLSPVGFGAPTSSFGPCDAPHRGAPKLLASAYGQGHEIASKTSRTGS